MTLRLVSCLGENTFPICDWLAEYLSDHLAESVLFIHDMPWAEARDQLAGGNIELGWLCGLLYTQQVDAGLAHYDIVAAPCFAPATTAQYYAYLVTQRESELKDLASCRGKHLVINEPNSYSGSHLLWAHLERQTAPNPYFTKVSMSGAHSASLRWIAQGRADVATIDHTVFAYLSQRTDGDWPDVFSRLKLIGQLGPAPAPPLVMQQRLALPLRLRLQALLSHISSTHFSNPTLAQSVLQGFAALDDSAYDVIRADYQASLRYRPLSSEI